jgi:hypothetical protein
MKGLQRGVAGLAFPLPAQGASSEFFTAAPLSILRRPSSSLQHLSQECALDRQDFLQVKPIRGMSLQSVVP